MSNMPPPEPEYTDLTILDKKYYLIIMGANISEIMIFYIMKDYL